MDASAGSIGSLLDDACGGQRSSLARLLSVVERGGPSARELERLVHPLGGAAAVVGITGSPGSGKSTLTNVLCAIARANDERIGVLAVDPSSPFTGGAILGDRVRMSDHTLDPGIFIRSMATRGHLGGLALATPAAIRVLDAVGFPWIVVETVGVGQVEVEIVGSADTTVVVLNPGWGDAVQANKAGLMEIADVFVINKADRPGAGDTERDVQQMLMMRADDGWSPPVVSTVASEGTGVDELWQAIRAHGAWLETTGAGESRRHRRVAVELRSIVAAIAVSSAELASAGGQFDELCKAVVERRIDPWSAADQLLADGDA